MKANNGALLVFIVLLVLKATKTVDWSWWWIFSPFWIPFAVAGVFVSVLFVLNRIQQFKRNRRRKARSSTK